MPINNEPRLALLHPTFRTRVDAIMEAVKTKGYVPWVVSTLRTPEEQARIHAVGRGTPGKPYAIAGLQVTAPSRDDYPKWAIVTKAAPFASAHQWGLAIDFGWVIGGKQLYDTPDMKYWNALYAAAQAQNSEDIVKAVPWDKAHIQSKAWHVVKANLSAYKAAYLQGKMEAVYKKLQDANVI